MLIVATTIAIVMAAVLVAPFSVVLSAEKNATDAAVRFEARFSWFGFSFPGRRAARAPAKTSPATPKRARGVIRWASIKAALTSPGFLRRLVRFLADLLQLAKPRTLHVQGRVGFEDPSETGMLLGWLYATPALPDAPKGWRIRVEPDFTGEIVEGRVHVRWSRNLGAMLWPLLRFAASPVVWRAFRAGWKRRERNPRFSSARSAGPDA